MSRVIFRVDKSGPFKGSITAIFVDELGTRDPLTRTCYAHIGQHGSCDWDWVVESTRTASPEEYMNLLTELKAIGYTDLEVLRTLRGLPRVLREEEGEE